MYIRLILAGALALMPGCKKDKEDIAKEKSVVELLTQKEWILTGHGFDDNQNDALNAGENLITACQQDNSYVFKPAGSGSSLDNAIQCGGPEKTDFEWALLSTDTKLEISFEKFSIIRLNENELWLSPDHPSFSVKYILTYRH